MSTTPSSNLSQGSSGSSTRQLLFPVTHQGIDVHITRNQDGSIQRSECVFPLIRDMWNKINDLILQQCAHDENFYYNVRAIDQNCLTVYSNPIRVQKDERRGEDTLHMEIRDKAFNEIRHVLMSGVGELFDALLNFFKAHDEAPNSPDGPKATAQELRSLLQGSNNAKIRFLDNILNLYLALCGKKYFNLVANLVIIGSYTFGSLFSVTKMYYQISSNLSGHKMLVGALRRVVAGNTKAPNRGEIHVDDGLFITYQLMFKLRYMKPKNNVTYVPIDVPNEDDKFVSFTSTETKVLKSLTSKPSTSKAAIAETRARNEYNSTMLKKRLVTYEGSKLQKQVGDYFFEHLTNGTIDELMKLNADKEQTLTIILEILDECKIFNHDLFSELKKMINVENMIPIITQITEHDCFNDQEEVRLISEVCPLLLAMNDVSTIDGFTYVELCQEDDASKLILRIISDLLDVMAT